LVIFNVLTPREALSGFSNEQIAVIVLLLVASYAVEKTRILPVIFSKIIPFNISFKSFIVRLTLLVATFSSFLNNTPIVAMLIPYVTEWARRRNAPLSKILIPLSYAAILGGTVTLIGTSTNLLVAALYEHYTGKQLGLFDFTPIGLPAAVVGLFYLLTIGIRLLPWRKTPLDLFLQRTKDYMVETVVNKGSPLVGKTIKEAGLRNLKGLFLAEILRDNKTIAPVGPQEVLQAGDILIFVGNTEAINLLLNSRTGLSLPKEHNLNPKREAKIVEAVVPANSPLVGKRVKDTNFRAKYDAVIIGVHRKGEKLRGKIGEIVLKPGDLLLLITGADFAKRVENSADFYPISHAGNLLNYNLKWGFFALGGFLAVLLLSALGILSLFKGLLIYLLAILVTRLVTYGEIKERLDINLIVIAALSLALGAALLKSGLAAYFAEQLIKLALPFGILAVLIALYLITNLLTEFITNMGAAAIAFPIAVEVAQTLHADLKPFALLVAFAASASFVSPIGYQTNLLVFSLGGYRFADFVKVGFGLSVTYGLATVGLLYLTYFYGK
jgi:di/tricarboxylate transporter